MSTKTKKYEMFKQEKHNGFTYYRIRAIKNFGNIKKGTIGGLIQSENNLSQNGNCWIDKSSIVRNPTIVLDNVFVCNESLLEDFVVFKGNRILENVQILDRCCGGIEWENKESKPVIINDECTLKQSKISNGWIVIPIKSKNPVKITLEFDSKEQLRKFDTAVTNIIDELSYTDTNKTFADIYDTIISEPISEALMLSNKLYGVKVKSIVKSMEKKYDSLNFHYEGDNFIHITHKEFDIDMWVITDKKGTYIKTSDDIDGDITEYFATEKEFKKELSKNLKYYDCFEEYEEEIDEEDNYDEDEDDIDD